MPHTLAELEPQRIWHWFGELCRVPHASGDEKAASDMVEDFARDLGLLWKRDQAGNLMVAKSGRGFAGRSAPVVLQAHLDMVAERLDGSQHDFSRDPIEVEVEGDWVFARETTLGADNGIGVAVMMALLEDDEAEHPPLECLFTVDEERGLTGASVLDPSWLTGRRMINLDSENEGRFCIGCAGGLDVRIDLPLQLERAPEDAGAWLLRVDGLRGGHSGMEIGRSRANAIRILSRALGRMLSCGASVAGLSGGSKRNAIPRNASAIIYADAFAASRCLDAAAALEREQRSEYSSIESCITVSFSPSDESPSSVLTASSARRAADLLLTLPHGVEKMSPIEEGLVETSVNLATVSTGPEGLSVALTVRSLLENAKRGLAERICAAARLAGCEAEVGNGYPGWRPDPSSPILKSAVSYWKEFSGREARVETVHAGLECGILGSRVGGMDMISTGPDIREVHAPGERVSISSTTRFWAFFRGLLERL